jgi:PAS domain S-box-containing protein
MNKLQSISYEEQLLINQASTHFDDQLKTRAWNAKHGGVYVYPIDVQEPNPYLHNNTIRDENNATLIRINPAWMTRQLSELSEENGYRFRITSLNPLNPKNKANGFEEKALRHIIDNNETSYYRFDKENKRFNYMGALITTASCLECHAHQGYKIGDIRGGISISLKSEKHYENKERIINNHLWQQIAVTLFSMIVLFLLYKIMKYDEKLEQDKKTIDDYFKIIDKNLIACYTDTDGVITDVSKAFTKISGYKKEDCIGKSNSFLMCSDTPEEVYKDLWERIESGLEWHGEIKNKKANGENYWVTLKTSPIYNHKSELKGYMIIYLDISHLKPQDISL